MEGFQLVLFLFTFIILTPHNISHKILRIQSFRFSEDLQFETAKTEFYNIKSYIRFFLKCKDTWKGKIVRLAVNLGKSSPESGCTLGHSGLSDNRPCENEETPEDM